MGRIKASAGVTSGHTNPAAVAEKSIGEPTFESTGARVASLTSTPGDGRANGSSEPIAAAELSAYKVAVFAKSLAQCGDLNLQVLLRDNDAWPHTTYELVFGDQRSVSLQQDQE